MTTLADKLREANIPFNSVDENGAVDCSGLGLDENKIDKLVAIVSEHVDPAQYALTKRIYERQLASKAEAGLATELRTVTAQGAVDYIENNVTNLASAKATMKIMARMLIALRDAQFPDLAEK